MKNKYFLYLIVVGFMIDMLYLISRYIVNGLSFTMPNALLLTIHFTTLGTQLLGVTLFMIANWKQMKVKTISLILLISVPVLFLMFYIQIQPFLDMIPSILILGSMTINPLAWILYLVLFYDRKNQKMCKLIIIYDSIIAVQMLIGWLIAPNFSAEQTTVFSNYIHTPATIVGSILFTWILIEFIQRKEIILPSKKPYKRLN